MRTIKTLLIIFPFLIFSQEEHTFPVYGTDYIMSYWLYRQIDTTRYWDYTTSSGFEFEKPKDTINNKFLLRLLEALEKYYSRQLLDEGIEVRFGFDERYELRIDSLLIQNK